MPEPKVTVRPLDAYTFDPKNANKGTDRGRSAVRKSIEEVGAARSVVSSADDVLLAGNQTMREARAAGIREVVEVETNGEQRVVVKRRDLKAGSERALKVGVYDNQASRLGLEWDRDALRSILDSVKVPAEIMTGDEIAALTGARNEPSATPQLGGLTYSVIVACASDVEQAEILERLSSEGLSCRALIS